MRTLHLRIKHPEHPVLTIDYDENWQRAYDTFDKFVDNFRTGWGDDNGYVTHVAFTESGAEPRDEDWRENVVA